MTLTVLRRRQSVMIVSYKLYDGIVGKLEFYWKGPSGRKWKLKLTPDKCATDGFGFAIYRGRYVGIYPIETNAHPSKESK